MNISSLNTPATPPYEYQNTTITTKEYDVHYFDRHLSPAHQSVDSDMETGHHSAFRRVSPISMPSPPELLIDSEEEFEEPLATPSHLLSNYILKQQGENQYTSSDYSMKQRKSVPHRSPIGEPSHAPLGESVVFQLDDKPSLICKPRIVNEKSLLWTLRQRVSSARQQQPYHRPSHHRLSAPRFERRAKPMRIQIPRPQWSTSDQEEEAPVSPPHWEATTAHQPLQDIVTSTVDVLAAAASWQADLMKKPQTALKQTERKKPSTKRPGSHHASSGRPSRVKGPCQACHETSDGCMRKAFNWPFSTSSIFNDKGKPFVYLCNKCGLR